MAKRLSAKKAKLNVFRLLGIIAVALLLSVLLPALLPNATGTVKSVVDWFVKVRDHFSSFWMFYSFILVIVIAYFAKKK